MEAQFSQESQHVPWYKVETYAATQWHLSMLNESIQVCPRSSKNLEEYVAKHLSKGYRLPKRADNPFVMGYCPGLDMALVLGPDEASHSQSLIGVMRWMVEMRCIDTNTMCPYYLHIQQCQDMGI